MSNSPSPTRTGGQNIDKTEHPPPHQIVINMYQPAMREDFQSAEIYKNKVCTMQTFVIIPENSGQKYQYL